MAMPFLSAGTRIALAVILLFAAGWVIHKRITVPKQAIKIGILHSLSGTMEISERPLVQAVQHAVAEINAAGGINGKMVETVVRDCRSDERICAKLAEQLVVEDQVSALFGCWASSCRKALKPVVEQHRHLLFYPVQYEGMEQSPNIIYTGAAPNQQIIPGTRWALDNLGKRVYLVGSDYVFPRMANVIIKDMLKVEGATLLGEQYFPLGSRMLDAVVADIARLKPEVVLNTLNGDSNIAFFAALDKAGIRAEKIPVLSFSIAEVELAAMPAGQLEGHYAAWNYFRNLPHAQNQVFIANFKARYGAAAILDDPMEASYAAVHLWAQAAREAGFAGPERVQQTILRQHFHAPQGMIAIDPYTRHVWKTPRVGRIRHDGQFDIVWEADRPVKPAPFPEYRTREDWLRLLHALEKEKS